MNATSKTIWGVEEKAMGATIVVDQEAAAFKPEGASYTVWCLFEKLYDKNTVTGNYAASGLRREVVQS